MGKQEQLLEGLATLYLKGEHHLCNDLAFQDKSTRFLREAPTLYPPDQTGIERVPPSVANFIPSLHGKTAIDLLSGANIIPSIFFLEKGAETIIHFEQDKTRYFSALLGFSIVGMLDEIFGEAAKLGKIRDYPAALQKIKSAFAVAFPKESRGHLNLLEEIHTIIKKNHKHIPFRTPEIERHLTKLAEEMKISREFASGHTNTENEMPIEGTLKKYAKSGDDYLLFGSGAIQWMGIYEAGFDGTKGESMLRGIQAMIDSGTDALFVDGEKYLLRLGNFLAKTGHDDVEQFKGKISGYAFETEVAHTGRLSRTAIMKIQKD